MERAKAGEGGVTTGLAGPVAGNRRRLERGAFGSTSSAGRGTGWRTALVLAGGVLLSCCLGRGADGSGAGTGGAAAASDVSGKYPASMLIKTRTATTYPEGMWVFTVVGTWFDADEKRNKGKDEMEDLPTDVTYRLGTSVLWAEYGVTDRLQLGLAAPVLYRRMENPVAGVNDTMVGLGDMCSYVKYKVITETSGRPGVSADVWAKLPTGDEDRGLGNDQTDITLALEVSKRIGCLSWHLNPEYVFTGGSHDEIGDAAHNRAVLNVGVMWHATASLVPMLEVNTFRWGPQGNQTDIGGGFLWFPTKSTSLKVGVSVPVDVDMPWSADWTPWVKYAWWF